ncbi:MAG: GTP 3',8-cyclase MoaA [Phycisphaeraceae bacterium]|nr:GTP 3',8-cyclase MoaA [Phycisphaeraceae bacterium]
MPHALTILQPPVSRPTWAEGPRDLASVRLLRLSITDRCNLRCRYCMPEEGVPYFQRTDVLSADQILEVAGAARAAGIDHFKITGGEPTVRRDLVDITRRLAELKPAELSLTTNGLRMDELAAPLADAGLDRVTFSCDSLQPDRYRRITRGRASGEQMLEQFHAGVAAAEAAGLGRIKINVVVIGGVNEDEVADFARLTLDRPWTVRFIEYMPLGDATLVDDADTAIVDNVEIRGRIESDLGPVMPVNRDTEPGVGPAEIYTLSGAAGRLGFISAMSEPFCQRCNRLRLTARGQLRACLFDGGEIDLLPMLRRGVDTDALIDAMARCVATKPDEHGHRGNRAMSQLGG